jgi:hypothetical protein
MSPALRVTTRSLLANLLVAALACSRVDVERVPVTAVTMDLLVAAVRDYAGEFGAPPLGDSRAIFRALRGENPRGLQFLQARRGEGSDELLDPWGHSYELGVLPTGIVRVRCAGPNGQLGDGDVREVDAPLKPEAEGASAPSPSSRLQQTALRAAAEPPSRRAALR